MAAVPFDTRSWALWYDDLEEARRNLLASLDELRSRADNFLSVAALATTMFAVLAPGPHPNGSDADPHGAPEPDTAARVAARSSTLGNPGRGDPVGENPVPAGPSPERPAPHPVPPATTTTATVGTDEPTVGRVRPSRSELPVPVEIVIPPGITSPNRAAATAGAPFTFTVTTTGTAVPAITEKGTLPSSLSFVDNGDGNATISGTPAKTGRYHTVIRAKFSKGANKYVVLQGFTLTVGRG